MLPTMAEHNPIQRRDTTPPNPTDRAARTNERKSHLRSLAVAGTLASVGAFTVLAASNTQVTQSTTPPATEQQVQDQVQGLDDGFTQVPDTTATPSQDDFFNQDWPRRAKRHHRAAAAGRGTGPCRPVHVRWLVMTNLTTTGTTFRAMGTEIAVRVGHETPAALVAEVRDLFEHWEAVLSRFLPDSELSRINAAAGTSVRVSPLVHRVICEALRAAPARPTERSIPPLASNSSRRATRSRSTFRPPRSFV